MNGRHCCSPLSNSIDRFRQHHPARPAHCQPGLPAGPCVDPRCAHLIKGDFLPRFRPATGQALLLEFDGQKILRFENLEITNGPSLHVYLSKDLSNKDVVDLGENLATKGNVNYSVPSTVNIEEYNYALIWSQKYGVLFAYTELQSMF